MVEELILSGADIVKVGIGNLKKKIAQNFFSPIVIRIFLFLKAQEVFAQPELKLASAILNYQLSLNALMPPMA
jgi:hypothetical protein